MLALYLEELGRLREGVRPTRGQRYHGHGGVVCEKAQVMIQEGAAAGRRPYIDERNTFESLHWGLSRSDLMAGKVMEVLVRKDHESVLYNLHTSLSIHIAMRVSFLQF